jgi:glycerol-3-phosphate dehydrogenase (NAD(P)+)
MKMAILGAGAWGSIFGQILRDAGHEACFWSVVDSELAAVKQNGFAIEKEIVAAVNSADATVVALSSSALLKVLPQLAGVDLKNKIFISLTKGIEPNDLRLPSEILADALSLSAEQVCVLSGPNLASELGQKLPTGAMLACQDERVAKRLANEISTDYFKLWPTADVRGLQIAGVYKNVLAIAAGVLRGAARGDNFAALFITKGLEEMARFGVALGGQKATFYGVAGLGDLLTTACSEGKSRNYSFGLQVGQTGSVVQTAKANCVTVEGYNSTKAITALAAQRKVETPITRLVENLLLEKLTVSQFLTNLQRMLLK